MEQASQDPANKPPPNLLAGLMGIMRNMLGLILSRIELAALEFSEVCATLLQLTLAFAFALMAIWFAVGFWSVLLVYLTWDSLGWKILFILAAGFSLTGIGLLWYARSVIAAGKLSLPATMNELRNDRDALL